MKLSTLLAIGLATGALLAMNKPAAAAPAAAPAIVKTMTIGDPKDPAALAGALQDAYKNGARKIVIRPGTYFLPAPDGAVFALNNWTDTIISAYGATLILTAPTRPHDVFDFNNCARVTLEGPVLSQNQMTSCQGPIVAIGKDDAGKDYVDWKPSAGYPAPPADAKKFPSGINILDAQTKLFKLGVNDYWDAPMESRPDGTFRIGIAGHFAVGDYLVGRYGDAPFKIHMNDSRDCTIKDVTMARNGFAPLFENDGGGNHYIHLVWAPGPPPAGATEKPLITNAADGMHMVSALPGPDIENCVFEGVFLDDCIAIHGYLHTIKAVSGATLTLADGIGALKVGDPVRISDTKGFFGEATAVSLKDNGDKTTTLVLDKDLGVPVGAKLSNPKANGAGFKIIGCHLGNTRSRGILVKADNGLIENNVIAGCGMCAISAGPEYYWGEADYVKNLTIIGNTLTGNGRFGGDGYGAAIWIHGDGAVGNRDIKITNNRFVSNYDQEMQIEWADGVHIAGNVITGAAVWPSVLTTRSPITLANSRGITLSGNIVHHASVYKSPLVAAGDNVTGLTNNDPSGVRAAANVTAR